MTQEEKNIAYDERIDQYLRGLMSEKERAVFEQDVKNDDSLRERFYATLLLVEGIRKEGARRNQAQFDAVKSMSEEEFLEAIKPESEPGVEVPAAATTAGGGRWIKWAVGIAAAIALIIAIKPLLFAPPSADLSVLEALVEEYNQPLDNAPKEFESIRDQINNSSNKDALALVKHIQGIGDDAVNSIEINPVETRSSNRDTNTDSPTSNDPSQQLVNPAVNYDDFVCWYKALAFMKAGEKDKAVEQLNNLMKNGTDRGLIEKAKELLNKINELK